MRLCLSHWAIILTKTNCNSSRFRYARQYQRMLSKMTSGRKCCQWMLFNQTTISFCNTDWTIIYTLPSYLKHYLRFYAQNDYSSFTANLNQSPCVMFRRLCGKNCFITAIRSFIWDLLREWKVACQLNRGVHNRVLAEVRKTWIDPVHSCTV